MRGSAIPSRSRKYTPRGLVSHQFVQHSERRFEVRVETKRGADFERVREEVTEQVDGFLSEKGFDELDYTISDTDEISVDSETGKRKMVVKDLED